MMSSFEINMAMTNDSGEYLCNATSPGYNTVSSIPITVLVQGKSSFLDKMN